MWKVFRNVIVGFDGSDRSEDAFALAASLTEREGRLTACCVQHVGGTDGRPEVFGTRPGGRVASCDELLSNLPSRTVRTETITLESADAARSLQRAAERLGADLLCLGSSHRGRLGQALLGSVSLQALHDPPCPVAIATVGRLDAFDHVQIASIAVGCDVSEEPEEEMRTAISLAAELGAALHVVAVADTSVALAAHASGAMAYPAIVRARRNAAEEGLTKLLEEIPATISATGEVREGKPAEKLVEVSHGVDLLILGSHHYGAIGRLMRHSVASSVARSAHCALLIVPREE